MGHGCPRERGILMSVTLQAPEHLSGTLSAGGSAPGTGASVGLVHSPVSKPGDRWIRRATTVRRMCLLGVEDRS